MEGYGISEAQHATRVKHVTQRVVYRHCIQLGNYVGTHDIPA